METSRTLRPLSRSTSLTWLAGAAMIAPAVAIVGVLFVYPFIHSLLASFQTKSGNWTLTNYSFIFSLYFHDLLFTVWVSLLSLVILLGLTVLLAGYLRLHHSSWIEFMFKIPLFVPFVVVGHAVRVFLAPHGTLNSALVFLTGHWFNPDQMPSIAFSTAGLIAALVWKNLAFSLLLVLGAFRGINNGYLEASRNFGAGTFRQITDIMIPMSKGAIGVSSVLMFTSMIGNFSIPAMLGNSGGNQVLMMDLYYQIVYQNNYGAANAIGVISYLVSMGAAIYYLRTVSRA